MLVLYKFPCSISVNEFYDDAALTFLVLGSVELTGFHRAPHQSNHKAQELASHAGRLLKN